MSETKTTTVARINKVDIVVIENGEKRVAIKPICEALGIDAKAQRERIKNDPILGSVGVLSTSTGSDGKQYEMFTIPFKYVFGWLFLIDSRNVKEESREAVLKYQMECYDVLYRHFTLATEFLEKKQSMMNHQIEIVTVAKQNYSEAHRLLKKAETSLLEISRLTVNDYDADTRQLRLFENE